MRGSLLSRVEKLEQQVGNVDKLTVVLVSFVENKEGKRGKLAGVELLHDQQFIERPATEPEDDFIKRVTEAHRIPWPNILVMKERRLPI